ncbi:MAG: YciI family protein [Bacteroidota bacterium]
MIIIDITYKVSLEKVDQHLEAHVAWLKEQYARGHFLASGPKIPRTGGVILSQLTDVEALKAVLAQDPFQQNGLAEYRLTEFEPRLTTEALQGLLG